MFLDRTKINFIQKWWLSIDRTMLGLIFILMLFGNIFVILASPVVANRIGIATNTFLVKNIIFSVVGFGIIIFLSTLNKKQIKILVPTCFVFLELPGILFPEFCVYVYVCVFFGLHLWHMEVPRLGVQSEL